MERGVKSECRSSQDMQIDCEKVLDGIRFMWQRFLYE